MSIFRSEEMAYQHIAMQKESAYEILNFLGEANSIQFVDMNENEPLYHRAFSKDVKRCEDVEIKLQQIYKEMIKRGIPITHASDIQTFLKNLNQYVSSRDQPEYTFIDEVETEVKERSQQLYDQTSYLDNLKEQRNQLIEQRAVLQQCKVIIADNNYFANEKNDEEDGFQFQTNLGLNYICGTVLTEESQRFKKIVFRATKGNNWTITNAMKLTQNEQGEFDIDLANETNNLPSKTIFMIVYSAGQNNYISNKLNRICDVFQAQRFALPSGQQGFVKKISEIDIQVKELEKLIQLTENKVKELLYYWGLKRGQKLPNDQGATQICSYIEELRLFIAKEKQIWIQMNYLDYKSSIYNGYFWCPISELSYVNNHIKGLQKRKPHLPQTAIESYEIPKHLTPPTFFKTNEFTAPFQQIVDTYGIPRYREINPAFFAVAMFPFKFGVMFGDIGHGGLLFAAGIALCLKKNELMGGALQPLLEARYLLLLMGFFAFYCGFIYNDFFSLPLNLFGSCWENKEDGHTELIEGCVHPFGLDPKWYIASNELAFFNSLKMKLAVIIGVTQMLWGIILKGWNSINSRNWIDFIFEFIPQIIFMSVTFAYMDFLVIYKWNSNFMGEASAKAPSIINQMINLPLKVGSTEGTPLWDTESQENLQYYILILSLLAVPTMLLPKPLILLLQNLGKNNSHSHGKKIKEPLLQNDDQLLRQELEKSKKELQSSSHGGGHGGHGHGEQFDFGEIFVHQIIETIEFVLGAISNTASYLRLWALSLAHSQLAKVFFEKTIGGGIVESNVISTMIGWVLFVNITMGVIMGMDLMECFLHALRLQWVEFQGKFFKADGYKFVPFSFKNSLKDAQDSILSETASQ